MNVDDPIVLYVILRQSLCLDKYQTATFTANAVQQFLLRYFTLQVLAVKTQDKLSECNMDRLQVTNLWLGSQSKKRIVNADEDAWFKIKSDFSVGRDVLCLKENVVEPDTETAFVFWPSKFSCMPEFIKALHEAE
jgi:hypothetical protein